ncbi:hypothetical protein KSP40_PGU003415 [Platanthera guangdongensis]|uniref:Uncharacterized protein n=1 Tax=Platanthera guangdongensis TaxID=2320717 RepID=A0ABR2MI54_9ASPA
MENNNSSNPLPQLHNQSAAQPNTHINNNNSSNSDDNYYDELYPPTTTRWSDLPRTEIPGFRLRIPAVPAGLTPQEEWNYVFTMIRRISEGH